MITRQYLKLKPTRFLKFLQCHRMITIKLF